MAEYQIRWAQLDLARQMESVEFIREMIRFLADAGYNGLLLYLEDRIRTQSYQLAGEGEYYTEDEIRALVEYGAGLGVELIPCVATLGHAERFLRHEEMRKFAELPDGQTGRFGGTRKSTFCITNPEFYDFIGTYLSEVAALFPSRWFHVGLDEFWDFKMCPRCRKLMPTLMDEQRFFLKHIQTVRAIMARLGKRIMMWSDMFEFYPDVFPEVPRDVVMVDWQYQHDVRDYLGHLLDVGVENRLAVNRNLGFDTVIAPADRFLPNAVSYMEYARDYPILGCILTCWEKSDTYLYRTLPMFAAAGRQMRGMAPEQAFQEGMRQIFGALAEDAVFAATVRLALTRGFWRHFDAVKVPTIFTRDYYGMAYSAMESDFAAARILASFRDRVKGELARRCLDDMLNALAEKTASHRLKQCAHAIFDRGATPERLAEFRQYAAEYCAGLAKMEEDWKVWRPGIVPNVFAASRERVAGMLEEHAAGLATGAWVKISCCLPDGYGVEKCRVSFLANGVWHVAGEGVFKAPHEDTATFQRFLPVPDEAATVEAVKVEASGLGGIGVSFVEVKLAGKHFVPCAVRAESGRVEHSAHLLDNDLKFAWFGGQSTRDDYFDVHAAAQLHSVTLAMREQPLDRIVFAG